MRQIGSCRAEALSWERVARAARRVWGGTTYLVPPLIRPSVRTGAPSPRGRHLPGKSQFIEVALGHTRPAHQKRVTPDGITRFWYECSYGTFGKGAPYRRFSASNLFRFHPHPYGMRLKPEGLSHGLKTVHRTVFTAACAAAALSSPARVSKNQIPEWVSGFLVRRKGLEPPTY